MSGAFDRTVSLIGEKRFLKLRAATVLVVGLGGVGGAALEALARSGIGSFVVVDGDVFEPSNLNRQILCTVNAIGKSKAEVAAERVAVIDPDAKVKTVCEFLSADNIDGIVTSDVTYCVDAIDDIRNKTALAVKCLAMGIPVVSAMGAGNRLDTDFIMTDVFDTKDDPFARKFRHELRKAGVSKLDVVCATTPPLVRSETPFSAAAPPMVMGLKLANKAVLDIINS